MSICHAVVTRDNHRTSAVTFAVSHNYPTRPDPTRPISSSKVTSTRVQDLHLQRHLGDAPEQATAGAGK